jgi:hypothetical protein
MSVIFSMTRTIQPCSWARIDNEGKDLTVRKPEPEDNMSLLLSVCNSLNNLYEKLARLSYVLRKKNMELNCLYKGMED